MTPEINWSRQSAVVVGLGLADGYTVEVSQVSRTGRQLTLDVRVQAVRRSGELDISPYHLIAVDTKAVGEVIANYDWDLPGLAASATAASCSSGQSSKAGHLAVGDDASPVAAESVDTPTASTMTWGRLKIRYR